mmetsp:Transcript_3243/g.9046  ORF Transcript_3243/g.9046 Transcript_3243/m.9046 type:complete len:354 (+) Transcript_3243:1123-2184(+)
MPAASCRAAVMPRRPPRVLHAGLQVVAHARCAPPSASVAVAALAPPFTLLPACAALVAVAGTTVGTTAAAFVGAAAAVLSAIAVAVVAADAGRRLLIQLLDAHAAAAAAATADAAAAGRIPLVHAPRGAQLHDTPPHVVVAPGQRNTRVAALLHAQPRQHRGAAALVRHRLRVALSTVAVRMLLQEPLPPGVEIALDGAGRGHVLLGVALSAGASPQPRTCPLHLCRHSRADGRRRVHLIHEPPCRAPALRGLFGVLIHMPHALPQVVNVDVGPPRAAEPPRLVVRHVTEAVAHRVADRLVHKVGDARPVGHDRRDAHCHRLGDGHAPALAARRDDVRVGRAVQPCVLLRCHV